MRNKLYNMRNKPLPGLCKKKSPFKAVDKDLIEGARRLREAEAKKKLAEDPSVQWSKALGEFSKNVNK